MAIRGSRPILLSMLALGVSTALHAEGNARQSPIDIHPAQALQEHDARIIPHFAHDATLLVTNTYDAAGKVDKEWSTLKATVPAGSSIEIGGVKYNLLQFHFHTPAEHEIDGKRAAMEVHFVFLRDDATPCGHKPDALLVIGALIHAGAPNPELGKIFNQPWLPLASTDPKIMVPHVDLNRILGPLRESWRYKGSLTAPASFVPACNEPEGSIEQQLQSSRLPENVSWVLLAHPVTLSGEQIDRFRKLFPEGNARQVMPVGKRLIFHDTN